MEKVVSLESLEHLIAVLKKYIDLVQKSDTKKYYMNDFLLCVLGEHLYNGQNWELKQFDAIFELTNVRLKVDESLYQFVGERKEWMSDAEWCVVRLFTDACVPDLESFHGMHSDDVYITKFKWLQQANETLSDLTLLYNCEKK